MDEAAQGAAIGGTLGRMAAETSAPPARRAAAKQVERRTCTLSLAGAAPEQRDALRRDLARLAALDAPHLSALRGIAVGPEAVGLTHSVAPDAVSWAELTARRPATPAETVAVGLALCQALGALHAAGLAHGAVCAEQVLVSGAGIAELAGCAGAWTPGAGPGPTAAADVRDLAGLLKAGRGPGAYTVGLDALLTRALDPDPARRPAVAELGRALEAQGTPALPYPDAFTPGSPATDPVPAEPAAAAPAPVGASRPPRGTPRVAPSVRQRLEACSALWSPARRWPRRRLLLTLAVLIGLGLIARGVIGLTVPGPGVVAVPSSATPAGDRADWSGTLVRLDAMRAAAMAVGSPAQLALAVDPEGPAYARDVATMTARGQAGLRLVGGAVTVRSALAVQVGSDRAELAVVDTRASYRLLGPGDRIVLAGPARSGVSWRVSLVRDGVGQPWRIHDAVRG